MTMLMVSYRRADTQDMAGRISDYLIGKYGEKSVFFDVSSIGTGRPSGPAGRTRGVCSLHGQRSQQLYEW